MKENRCPPNEPHSLEKIIQENYDGIYQYCFWKVKSAQDAQDITQEVFYKFISNMETYQERGNVKAFLYTIARNLCINWSRHETKYETIAFTDQIKSEDGYERMIDQIDLEKSIRKLSPPQQELLMLRFSQELSVNEIAKIFHTNRFTIYYELKIALRKLRQAYERR